MLIVAYVQRLLLTMILRLPRPLRRAIAGPERVEDGQTLDLDAQLLCRLDELLGSALSGGSVDVARKGMSRGAYVVSGPKRAVAAVQGERVRGGEGMLAARRYTPLDAARTEPTPLIVYFHGGGWVVGDLDSHDNVCRALAQAAGAVVVSVDYRLAPEHPYPAAVDDAVAAVADIRARAAEFGADSERIVVCGDSAGGYLSTMACLRAIEEGQDPPAAQVLIYPVTDLVGQTESARRFGEGMLLTDAEMSWFKDHFTPDHALRAEASPLHAGSLAGMPPAMVITAGFDPLRDEGEAYARALAEAGCTVHLRRHPGQVHGFINGLGIGQTAERAIGEIAGVVGLWLQPAGVRRPEGELSSR